jgi:hypothetical protein
MILLLRIWLRDERLCIFYHLALTAFYSEWRYVGRFPLLLLKTFLGSYIRTCLTGLRTTQVGSRSLSAWK